MSIIKKTRKINGYALISQPQILKRFSRTVHRSGEIQKMNKITQNKRKHQKNLQKSPQILRWNSLTNSPVQSGLYPSRNKAL